MKQLKVVAVSLILVLIGAGVLSAQETRGAQDTKGTASLGLYSDYLWRGLRLSDGWVLQPAVGITYKGFGAKVWNNWDENQNELTETDVNINYMITIDKIKLGVGYIYYSWNFESGSGNPAQTMPQHTHELYASAACETMLLSPKATFYLDVDKGSGGYLEFILGHSFDLTKDIPSLYMLPKNTMLDLGAIISINFENDVVGAGDDYTNFQQGELSADLNIPITANISVLPKIAYSFPLSGDAKHAMNRASFDDDSEKFYGGVLVKLQF